MLPLLLIILMPILWFLLVCLIVPNEEKMMKKPNFGELGVKGIKGDRNNEDDYKLRMKFLDNYDWACNVFGARDTTLPYPILSYELGLDAIKESNECFDRWFIYRLANDPNYYYPNVIEDVHTESVGNGMIHNNERCTQYMEEFNKIVLQYRSQQATIEEVKGLGIPLNEYLKPVTKYKPQPIILD